MPVLLALLALVLSVLPVQAQLVPTSEQPCGYTYPETGFTIADGGQDSRGAEIRLCTAYNVQGGPRILGYPISQPFRVDGRLFQAFEYAVLEWRPELGDAVALDTLDVLSTAGRDPWLARIGIPPRETGTLSDPAVRAAYFLAPSRDTANQGLLPGWTEADAVRLYGLPTSPPADEGHATVQRFQRGVLRAWKEKLPNMPDPGRVTRLRAGELLRDAGLIPHQALLPRPPRGPAWLNGAGAPVLPLGRWVGAEATPGGWELLYQRTGAFDVGASDDPTPAMAAEVRDAADLGLNLAVSWYQGRQSLVTDAFRAGGVRYLDNNLWTRVVALCDGTQRDTEQPCAQDPGALLELEQAVRSHLARVRDDDLQVGFWVLDDYPGDVSAALDLVYRLVQEENRLSRLPRFTVCGIEGLLDTFEDGHLTTHPRELERAVRNFSPTACDAVALYAYGMPVSGDPVDVDWSMEQLLPRAMELLRARGWDPSRQPFLGVVQAFGTVEAPPEQSFVLPRAQDVATQAEAYCRAGATGILHFAWNDLGTGPKVQLAQSPDLRAGVADGVQRCQAAWSSALAG